MRASRGIERALAVSLVSWIIGAGLPGITTAATLEHCGRQRPLAFELTQGENINRFYRDGPVAAHLAVRSGTQPHIVIAFPAGDSGAGVWFAPTRQPVRWEVAAPPRPVRILDRHGRPMYGITAELRASGADLQLQQAVLSSIRALREYAVSGSVPADIRVTPLVHDGQLSWSRQRLDGKAEYRLNLVILRGRLQGNRIAAAGDGRIELRITALSGETPLTPLSDGQLLRDCEAALPATQDSLLFLSYKEKLLAGSWRYDTYFGRDTLISVALLMPDLRPEAVGWALRSVLTRLSAIGEVAHEEDIGEEAILDHVRAGDAATDAPVYSYTMIDENYLLAIVLGEWLSAQNVGQHRVAALLRQKVDQNPPSSSPLGSRLVTNLRYVLRSAAPFSISPTLAHLIGLKSGAAAGQWRDSNGATAMTD